MVGRVVGNGDTFFPMVFYTWLEYGRVGDSVHSYCGGGLYFCKCSNVGYMYCRCCSQIDMRSVFVFSCKTFKVCSQGGKVTNG